ncbi:PLP-dependent aminotransferase family protein [Thalassococcus sp. S3]|uniref:aminotransferase-like domain-containing protein n=1 Tax=Thalassococcus sp. S3 TaxID=2017482 RepID=UPI0010244D63|nr:PLP-dependent aminotransferase family protein [Thalassococcus sp. S3]QBF31711.1 aspartate aminotransferase [Thalassococcus sp. S3]
MNTISLPPLETKKGPKYKVVADTIRSSIESGTLTEGTKLPPVRDLAYQLSITPGTVARAYTILTDEGLLMAEVGRGTFVAPPKTLLQDDVWSRQTEPPETDAVSLFSPRLADVGQVAAIRSALRQVAEMPPERLLSYPTRDGYAPARQAVVDWLADMPLGTFTERDVVLTHGGQNGICVCLNAILTGPRPVLLVEDLSYAGFRRAAELMRADVVGVAMDEHGVRPEALDQAARQSGAQVFCTSPEVQNPTGGHTPLARREELIAVAQKHGLQIIEDDCYRMGEAREPSYRALYPRHTWHVSSISKTLTPSLRVGFAIAPKGRAADLRRAAEYGFFGMAQPLAELTRILLSDPRTRELSVRVRETMSEYVRVAVNALGGFDLVWDPDVPFVWLRLPSGWRAAAFCREAEAVGVQIRSADEFALRDGRAPHAVRIAMNAHVALSSFEEAMLRLRRLLDNPPEQISV